MGPTLMAIFFVSSGLKTRYSGSLSNLALRCLEVTDSGAPKGGQWPF